MNRIFVGYDRREDEAYRVCRKSILRYSRPMWISKLDIDILGRAGIYTRKWYRNVNGQKYDALDYKPFSTDFAFTRFLVPALSLYNGWALFCDCDFLFTADLGELFSLADPEFAVMCVKHRHVPLESEKMDGVVQTRYYRKNWSSLVLWNCEHPANGHLTLDCVNKTSGQWLHAFSWLKDGQIGELPRDWNHLVGYDTVPLETPRGIHFTSGIPTMEGYEDGDYADLWLEERDRSLSRFTEVRS